MTSSNDPWIGKPFGKYLIKACLGRGGMGIVYEAEDLHLLRAVALKMLPEQLADRDTLLRFQREAQAAARLNHPNVVAVYDIGQRDKMCYIAMELVRGESLQEIVERGPMPWREAAWVVAEVCRGLAAAHAAGLIHRDIKPSNLLRSSEGAVKIADFGLVRINADNFPRLTHVNRTLGTPAFMSPEQCRAERLDARTDLYSLGATFYVLLTGIHPFVGKDDVAVLAAHCMAPVPDPRAVRPDVPEACTDLIRRAMAKNCDRRIGSASEMLHILTQLLTSTTAAVAVVPPAPLPAGFEEKGVDEAAPTVRLKPLPTRKPARNRRIWYVAAGAAGVVVLGLGLWLLLPTGTARPPDAPGEQVEKKPDAPIKPDPRPIALRPGKKWKAHDLAVTSLAYSAMGERLYSGSLDKSVRCWVADQETRRWNFDKKIHAVALAPDEKSLAAGGDDCRVYVWEPAAGQPVPAMLPRMGDSITALAFSPRDDLLAVGTGGGFQVWGRGAAQAFTRRYVYPKTQYNVAAVAFASDGKTVAWGSYQREVHVIQVPGWQSRASGFNQPAEVSAIALTSNGQGVFFGGRCTDKPGVDGVLLRWNWMGGKNAEPVDPPCLVRTLALAPGGSTLVAAGEWGGPLRLYDLPTGPVRKVGLRANTTVHVLCFSADGKSLAAGCENGEIHTWEVTSLARDKQ